MVPRDLADLADLRPGQVDDLASARMLTDSKPLLMVLQVVPPLVDLNRPPSNVPVHSVPVAGNPGCTAMALA